MQIPKQEVLWRLLEGGGLQGHGTVDKSQETGPVHINLTPAEHPPQLSMDARKDAGLDSCFPPAPTNSLSWCVAL